MFPILDALGFAMLQLRLLAVFLLPVFICSNSQSAFGQAAVAGHGIVDATATRLNPESDKLVFTGAIHNLTFSPDGQVLAAGQGTGKVFLWDVVQAETKLQFQAHSDWAFTIAFDKEGKRMITGGGDNLVLLWDVASLDKPSRRYEKHTGDVHSVAVTPDSRYLISAGDDMAPIIWDYEAGEVIKQLPTQARQIPGLAISPDGETLATVNRQGELKTFGIPDGQQWLSIQAHENDVITVVYSRDGQRIVTGGYDSTVAIWDGDMGYLIKRFTSHEGPVVCVDISPDGKSVVSIQGDRALVWPAAKNASDGSEETVQRFSPELNENEQLSFCRFSPDGETVAIATTGGRIFLVSSDLSEVVHTFSAITDFETELEEKK